MTQGEWEEFWSQAPRQAEVDAAIRKAAAHQEAVARAALVAAWRQRHPWATCRDEIAYYLADLERTWSR